MAELPKLTDKEEEVMSFFWNKHPLTIREVVESYPEPRPHFNTVSTFVTILEKKGYLTRTKKGVSSYFSPTIEKESYGANTLKGVLSRFFDNSFKNIVASLVKDKSLSVEEIKELIDMVESQNDPNDLNNSNVSKGQSQSTESETNN